MKSCSKKILIDMIKPKKNTMHLLCRLTPRRSKRHIACSDFFYKKPERAHSAALPLPGKGTLGSPAATTFSRAVARRPPRSKCQHKPGPGLRLHWPLGSRLGPGLGPRKGLKQGKAAASVPAWPGLSAGSGECRPGEVAVPVPACPCVAP